MESTVYQRDRNGNLVPAPAITNAAVKNIESPSADPVQAVVTGQSEPPNTPKPKRTRRRILPKAISRPIKIFFIAYLLLFIWVGIDLSGNMQKVDAMPNKQIPPTAGSNWLLVGSDSREGLSWAQQKGLHTGGNFGPPRSDTIMIVHIGTNGKPTLISLPRDSWVKLPTYKSSSGRYLSNDYEKINASYSFGGPKLLVRTIESNTGLHIDHYMSIGLLGVRSLADAVGGVRLCPKQNFNDRDSGLKIKKGCQVVNGKKALAYVRMRHADPLGDIGRVQRQQEFVSAVLHKSLSPAVLLNPFKLRSLGRAAEAAVKVDQQDSLTDLGRFALAMRAISKGTGRTMTVPIADSNGYRDGQSVVLWDDAKARKLFKSLGAH